MGFMSGRKGDLSSCPGDVYCGTPLPGVMGGVGFPASGELGYPGSDRLGCGGTVHPQHPVGLALPPPTHTLLLALTPLTAAWL